MAATLGAHSSMTIARDTGFQDRVRYWMFSEAVAVVAEGNTTPNHAARVAYAQKIFAETADVFAMTVGVLSNATIAAEQDTTQFINSGFAIPDSDMQFAVNSLFNAYAGVAT